ARPHARQALATASTRILPVTTDQNLRYPSPDVNGLNVYFFRSARISSAARIPSAAPPSMKPWKLIEQCSPAKWHLPVLMSGWRRRSYPLNDVYCPTFQ